VIRDRQLVKSENLAALGYIATDTTYSVALYLDELQTELESIGDTKNAATLKPIVTLLSNLNLIAADQDETKLQSFDVVSYMKKMVMLYEFEFKQSNIAYLYSGEQSLTIKSVPSYIALMLLNVINNSLKHGFNNNGQGKISLNVEKDGKNGTKITYSDDGKGMSKAVLNQVFEPFFTTHSDRGYVGLGMSTVHDLIKDKLSGDIKIESQEGKGTTVLITLP
jgi:signal transduction histidine kinase